MTTEIKQLYSECTGKWEACVSNKDRINHILSSFVAGTSILNSMDADEVRKLGPEIELPGTEAEYDYSIKIVRQHVESLDLFHEKCKELKTLIDEQIMDNELLKIQDQIHSWMNDVKKEILEYEDIIQKLYTFKQIIFERDNHTFMKNVNTADAAAATAALGGGGGSAAGSVGGGSPSTSAPSTSAPQEPLVPDLGDYTPAVVFPNLNVPSSLATSESNLEAHAQDVGKILSHCIINGQIIGEGVYPTEAGLADSSDIGCDFMALQLSLDYVKADIEATTALMEQMKTSIENNKAKISEYQAKMKATKLVADYDEKGKCIGYHEEPLYNHSVLQTAINTLEAQNTALEGKIDHYQAEKIKKQNVFNSLINYRNAYNQAYNGLVNVFTAVDGLNAVSQFSDEGALYGLALSDTDKMNIFNHLKMSLEANQNQFTLVSGDDYNIKEGQFSIDQFKYLLESCSILANSAAGSFAENVKTWKEKEVEKAAKAEQEEKEMNGKILTEEEEDAVTAVKDEETEKTTLDKMNEDLKESATTTVNKKSNVQVKPEVEQFLKDNAGKTVVIDDDLRHQLGLQNTGLISIPENYDSSQAYPFLLWLVGTGHAAGSAENLKTDSFAKTLYNGNYENKDAIIYMPTGWGNGQADASLYSASELNHDFDQMVGSLNVDQDRISGAGTSIGAFALAYLTTSHPNTFSAVAMTGGGYSGGPNHGISVQDAIAKSPDTTYIWYTSNSDNSSHIISHGNDTGIGVNAYCKDQHQALQDAGVNSVYYEVGAIGHADACQRFATGEMLHDLTHITKGEHFDNLPTDITKVTPQQSIDGSLAYGHSSAAWYKPLST